MVNDQRNYNYDRLAPNRHINPESQATKNFKQTVSHVPIFADASTTARSTGRPRDINHQVSNAFNARGDHIFMTPEFDLGDCVGYLKRVLIYRR
jgi:hypothetical protein